MKYVVLLFTLDAAREVQKYSIKNSAPVNNIQPNMSDHMHMKLFRAQRNLYISGFTVFFWLWVCTIWWRTAVC